jgi:hypothetical protein
MKMQPPANRGTILPGKRSKKHVHEHCLAAPNAAMDVKPGTGSGFANQFTQPAACLGGDDFGKQPIKFDRDSALASIILQFTRIDFFGQKRSRCHQLIGHSLARHLQLSDHENSIYHQGQSVSFTGLPIRS